MYPVPDATGKYPITRGQVLGVLPFGNVSATLTINGAELKDYLETAVSSLPATGNGRFGQVSGLCFTFDVEGTPASFSGHDRDRDPGHRAAASSSAVRQAADGSCTGAAISFARGVNYTLTTNDFTAGGGDGYPNFRSRMTTQDILDQDLADYLAAAPGGVISPAIQHRIHCTDPNPGGGIGLPGRVAVATELEPGARGPAASRGGPPTPSAASASRVPPSTSGERATSSLPPSRRRLRRRRSSRGTRDREPLRVGPGGTRQRKIRWLSRGAAWITGGSSAPVQRMRWSCQAKVEPASPSARAAAPWHRPMAGRRASARSRTRLRYVVGERMFS